MTVSSSSQTVRTLATRAAPMTLISASAALRVWLAKGLDYLIFSWAPVFPSAISVVSTICKQKSAKCVIPNVSSALTVLIAVPYAVVTITLTFLRINV